MTMLFKRKNEPSPRIIIPEKAGRKELHPIHIYPRGIQSSGMLLSTILFFLIVMIILMTFLIQIAKKMPIHGIHIDLPKSDGITHVFESNTMLVTIMQGGEIYFNEQKMDSIENLKDVLSLPAELTSRQTDAGTIAGTPADTRDILLQCDKNVPSDLLFKFFSAMKDLNIRVFMITKPESSKSVHFDDGKN